MNSNQRSWCKTDRSCEFIKLRNERIENSSQSLRPSPGRVCRHSRCLRLLPIHPAHESVRGKRRLGGLSRAGTNRPSSPKPNPNPEPINPPDPPSPDGFCDGRSTDMETLCFQLNILCDGNCMNVEGGCIAGFDPLGCTGNCAVLSCAGFFTEESCSNYGWTWNLLPDYPEPAPVETPAPASSPTPPEGTVENPLSRSPTTPPEETQGMRNGMNPSIIEGNSGSFSFLGGFGSVCWMALVTTALAGMS